MQTVIDSYEKLIAMVRDQDRKKVKGGALQRTYFTRFARLVAVLDQWRTPASAAA